MSNVVPFLEYMSPLEVRRTAERGTRIATKLRDDQQEQRFRFPHATFTIAMRNGYGAAARFAQELASGDFTMDEAMRHVRKVFAEGKAEIKDRAG